MLRRNMLTAACQKSGDKRKTLGLHSTVFSELGDGNTRLNYEIMTIMPKITCKWSSWVKRPHRQEYVRARAQRKAHRRSRRCKPREGTQTGISAVSGKIGGAGRNRTAVKGFADLCLTTWRPRPVKKEPITMSRTAPT